MAVVFGTVDRDTDRFRLTLTEDFIVVDSALLLTEYLDQHPDEDLVLIGPDVPMGIATDVAERYRADRPSLGVVLVRRRVEVQAMAEALRSGMREVVGADDAESLILACQRSKAVSQRLKSPEQRASMAGRGKVVLVFAAKGGSGKTTISTNLAQALALSKAGTVCLVDFNLELGDVAVALQVEPVRTISNAVGMQGGLDQHAIKSLVVPYRDNVDLLLAPTQPTDATFISAALAGEIVGLLTEMYDFVVIDSPPAFNDVVLKCFDLADACVLITGLDMLALKNFKVTRDTLDALGYPRSRWSVALNRCDSRVGLAPGDIERLIDVPIATRLPSSVDVPASLNRGTTLVESSPRHPFSRGVFQLAKEMSAHEQAAAERHGRRFSLLHRSGS